MPDQPRRRRWPRRVLVTVLALVLLLGVVGFVAHLRVPEDSLSVVEPGELRPASGTRGSWQVGAATVRLTDSLEITERGRTIWASVPGQAFLTGSRGSVDWEESKGYFWPTVEHRDELSSQTVDRVVARPGRLVVGGRLSGGSSEAPYTLTVRPRDGSGVTVDVTTGGGLDAVGLVGARSPGAGVHGFGEQFTDFDLDGRLLPIVVREQGVGRGTQPLSLLADLTNHGAGGTEQMTYAAWSAFVTDDLRSVRLDPDLGSSHAFAVADTRDPRRVGLEVWAPRLRAELVGARSPAELVSAAGGDRPGPPLADWTQHGAIVGLQGGTAKVRREVAQLRGAGAAISGVWLQDWTGQRRTSFGDRLWWTWQLDRRRYPGWQRLVEDLRSQGIRTTTYVNPFLTDAEAKGDAGIRNLWAEARAAGYLVETGEGEPYRLDQGGFDASLVDLTDDRARAWFARVIAEEVLAGGVDGVMADFGEGLPMDAVLANGDAAVRHNEWPLLWARTVREACRLAGRPDCVTWFRSGSLGMQEHAPLFWNGDQLVDFGAEDGLASVLLGTFSAGVSGWPLVHSDIGGYTSIDAKVRDYTRSPELLARWAELGAFGVVMRTHEGNRPAENAQVYDTPEAERAFARMTRVFAALAPYRRDVLRQAREGVPAIRHGWLTYPRTAAARSDTQFFLGRSVLVAPVLQEGADSVGVTFPPGRWVHLVTGREYDGDRTVSVPAPLGRPAAFARADDPWTERLRSAVAPLLRD